MARKNQYPERKYTDTHASCSKCSSMKPFSDFHKCKTNPKGITYWCKECTCKLSREHHKKSRSKDLEFKNKRRDYYVKRKHGITLQQYEEKLAAQNNECAICGVKLSTSGLLTHLDHDHKTGMLRSFLCTNCNRGLGHFQDNKSFLMKAIQYLDSHNQDEDLIKEENINDRTH